MITLLFAVIFGLGFAIFATQNTSFVTVNLGNYVWNIPLYFVMLGSLLVGLMVAWLFSLVDGVSSAWALHGKDSQIHKAEDALFSLEKRVNELQAENAQLRNEKQEVRHEEHDIHTKEPNFLERLKHRISVAT